MIQPRTQTREYWEHEFSITESDVEQIYNHFIEVERPQSTADIVRSIMQYRIMEERNELLQKVSGRMIYQPRKRYAAGDELVFPAFDFATGTVTALRDGHNPHTESFKVITVRINGRERFFASELLAEHPSNLGDDGIDSLMNNVDVDELYGFYSTLIENKVTRLLENREGFIRLGGMWFVQALLAEINIGHLHLAEAVLDMFGGGPLSTPEIVVHLDMDGNIDPATQEFSLNNALLEDRRFDEVALKNQVKWFLNRLEPEEVRVIPERLAYQPVAYDRALLSPQLTLLERELSDEWSGLESADFMLQSHTITLLYPHRLLGTLPLTSTLREMIPLGRSPRQTIILRDAETGNDINAWVVQQGRYIFGLKDWYAANEILVGAYVTVRRGPEPHILILDYDRRRPQLEDIRLATVVQGRIRFQHDRRRVGCGYDDLMVVGTDYTAAINIAWKQAKQRNRSTASLAAALLPELAVLTPQKAVHAKTLYSVLNMVRRVPPGPLFADLVRHSAFEAVGDQYWRFNTRRWQRE